MPRPAFWHNLGCFPSHFSAPGTDLRSVLPWFVQAQGHGTLLRRDGACEGLFLWKVLKAKEEAFAKHPRGHTQIQLGQKVEHLTVLPGWEMTKVNNCSTWSAYNSKGPVREAAV